MSKENKECHLGCIFLLECVFVEKRQQEELSTQECVTHLSQLSSLWEIQFFAVTSSCQMGVNGKKCGMVLQV